ncbi:hypothetical protein [Megasphaera vaginalis (ex Bordigoni et al. 2020)]|uniref:hypothetical protein n=1 Tax=Megasphaera vaginalis (ex Bordigoni et al. 2020) TaxID=2045301 RepID=UPI000C7C97B5|nr:hypothetical protein [Megasphaera vaginalis (ex Bordigoni et al. 2020)]
MKKCIALFLMIFALTGFAAAADSAPLFDHMRNIIIVDTTQEGPVAAYMSRALRQPFRIPYWNRLDAAELIAPEEATPSALRGIAKKYDADIVLVPVVRNWYWNQFHSLDWYGDEDEWFVEYNYDLAVCAYNRRTDTYAVYACHGHDRDDASVLNSPAAILRDAMDTLLEKLPYKRIPTDLEELYGVSDPLQLRQTAGGAKLWTNADKPVAI